MFVWSTPEYLLSTAGLLDKGMIMRTILLCWVLGATMTATAGDSGSRPKLFGTPICAEAQVQTREEANKMRIEAVRWLTEYTRLSRCIQQAAKDGKPALICLGAQAI